MVDYITFLVVRMMTASWVTKTSGEKEAEILGKGSG